MWSATWETLFSCCRYCDRSGWRRRRPLQYRYEAVLRDSAAGNKNRRIRRRYSAFVLRVMQKTWRIAVRRNRWAERMGRWTVQWKSESFWSISWWTEAGTAKKERERLFSPVFFPERGRNRPAHWQSWRRAQKKARRASREVFFAGKYQPDQCGRALCSDYRGNSTQKEAHRES